VELHNTFPFLLYIIRSIIDVQERSK